MDMTSGEQLQDNVQSFAGRPMVVSSVCLEAVDGHASLVLTERGFISRSIACSVLRLV